MNIVRSIIEAKRDLRSAEKTLRNFELVADSLNAEIAQLHAPGLKSARAKVEAAQRRVTLEKERVRIRIKLLKTRAAVADRKKA